MTGQTDMSGLYGQAAGQGFVDLYSAPPNNLEALAQPQCQVHWITLTQPSQITMEGFPPQAPALIYDKAATIFSLAHHILQELVGDIAAQVQIIHDPDWEQFP